MYKKSYYVAMITVAIAFALTLGACIGMWVATSDKNYVETTVYNPDSLPNKLPKDSLSIIQQLKLDE